MKSIDQIVAEFLKAAPVPRGGFCTKVQADRSICSWPRRCKRPSSRSPVNDGSIMRKGDPATL